MKTRISRVAAVVLAFAAVAAAWISAQDSTAQPVPKRPLPVTNLHPRIPTAARPSLAKFNSILAASHTAAEFERNLVAAAIVPKIRRICIISGGYPAGGSCKTLHQVLTELQLSAADQSLMTLGLNDLWDMLGGDPAASGDLIACGGARAGSFTNLMANRSSAPAGAQGGFGASRNPKGGTTSSATLTASDLAQYTDGCRASQAAGLKGGIGATSPTDAAYAGAAQNAVAAMDAAMAACHDSGNGMVATPGTDNPAPAPAPPPPPPPPPPPAEAPPAADPVKALKWVFDMTVAIADTGSKVLTQCEHGTTACAVGAVLSIATATSAAGSISSETAEHVNTAATIASGIFEFAVAEAGVEGGVIAGTASFIAADAVLPAAAAFGAGFAAARPIGDALWGKLGEKWGDYQFNHASAGGGARTPAPEGGKPSCAAMQERWAKFKAYCSQAGNNWQTYDCMKFVAKMNGCADPGLVQPGPEGEYVCTAKCAGGATGTCRANQAAEICGLRQKWRGKFSTPSPEGSHSTCTANAGALIDFSDRLHAKICERMSPGDSTGGACGMPGRDRMRDGKP